MKLVKQEENSWGQNKFDLCSIKDDVLRKKLVLIEWENDNESEMKPKDFQIVYLTKKRLLQH